MWWTSYNRPQAVFDQGSSYGFHYDNDHNRVLETIHRDGHRDGASRVKVRAGGIYEEETQNGSLTRRRYIPTPVGIVGMSEETPQLGVVRRYFLGDTLGSSNVLASDSGTIVTEYSYDAWGNPRDSANWSLLGQWPDYEADRGFTGHEMMSGPSLVHMNGRIYDPTISRFLSPDPFVQTVGDLQNYNRYSYVLNNPLRYTDPSGYFFAEIAFFVSIVAELSPINTALLLAAGTAVDAYIETGDVGLALRSGVVAGLSVFVTHSVGDWFDGPNGGFMAEALKDAPDLALKLTKATFHGIRGGFVSELQGGNFGSGFASAFAGDFVGEVLFRNDADFDYALVASALVGGTASVVGGGKFANGALSGAITFALNTASHVVKDSVTKHGSIGISEGTGPDGVDQVVVSYRQNWWQWILGINAGSDVFNIASNGELQYLGNLEGTWSDGQFHRLVYGFPPEFGTPSGAVKRVSQLAKTARIGASAKKLSVNQVGQILGAGKNWHKTGAKGKFLNMFKNQMKGDKNADFFMDKVTKEVLLRTNKRGEWIQTGVFFD